jgi:DDE_Tnp_1-associated
MDQEQPSRQERRREELKRRKEARRQARRELRQRQAAEGLLPGPKTTIENGKSAWKTIEEEKQARQGTAEEQLRVYHAVLPRLLKRLAKISDPRNPLLIRHKLTVLLLYGILMFVFQVASRRQANREMSLPMFLQNLQLLFPELESLPHADTLNRLLARIAGNDLQESLLEMVEQLMRQKKFFRYLIAHCYPIAIDGTGKLMRDWLWTEQCLERQVQTKQEDGTAGTQPQYYVYVLEAQLAFANGMTIPLLSEFLDYGQGDQQRNKQDCELRAFYRLAQRLKEYFPRLPVLLLLDGLYASGPVMELCRDYHWQFMIVLQDDSLPSVWEEFAGLGQLQHGNRLQRTWGNRRQRFRWVNRIEYFYGEKARKRQILHVVVCEESWEEIAADSLHLVEKKARHAWISSGPLNRENVHERCNLGARHRWGIEESVLAEKHQGYGYEHGFSYNWEAMRGFHFLMQIAHLLNTLVENSARLARLVRSRGVRGLIQFFRTTCSGPWLEAEPIRQLLASPSQIRLD